MGKGLILTQNKNTTNTCNTKTIEQTFEQLELQQNARIKPDGLCRIASLVPLLMLFEKS